MSCQEFAGDAKNPERRTSLSPQQLEAIGRALYGNGWQSALAGKLGVGNLSVHRWAHGQNRVRKNVPTVLAQLIADRIEILRVQLDQLALTHK